MLHSEKNIGKVKFLQLRRKPLLYSALENSIPEMLVDISKTQDGTVAKAIYAFRFSIPPHEVRRYSTGKIRRESALIYAIVKALTVDDSRKESAMKTLEALVHVCKFDPKYIANHYPALLNEVHDLVLRMISSYPLQENSIRGKKVLAILLTGPKTRVLFDDTTIIKNDMCLFINKGRFRFLEAYLECDDFLSKLAPADVFDIVNDALKSACPTNCLTKLIGSVREKIPRDAIGGSTLLHIAASLNHVRGVELLAYLCDPTAHNQENKLATDLLDDLDMDLERRLYLQVIIADATRSAAA